MNNEQARELLTQGVKADLVLPPQPAEGWWTISYFACRSKTENLPSGIHTMGVHASEPRRRDVGMQVLAHSRLQDHVVLGGCERRGAVRASVMIIERKEVYNPNGDWEGYKYEGRARLGRPGLRDLKVYYPAAPLPITMMEDDLILELFARAAINNKRTRFGVNWTRFANLLTTPTAVRQAILRPYSVA